MAGATLAIGAITLPTQRLVLATAGLLLVTGGCGGSSSSSGSSSSPTAPSSNSSYRWSITGNVVDTVGHQTIGGATVKPGWNLAAVSSNGDGTYLLGSNGVLPSNPS